MEELKFDFLKKTTNENIDLLERNLREIGQKLSEIKEYLYYVVSTHSQLNEQHSIDEVKSAALLLLIPNVGYNYRFLTLDYRTKSFVIAKLFDLSGQNIKQIEVDISNDKHKLTTKLIELLTSEEAANALSFFIERVEEEMFQEI